MAPKMLDAQRVINDYKKFKGFRPCGMLLEEEKKHIHTGACNLCPPRRFPPCRDEDHAAFDPHNHHLPHRPFFRPCRAEDFKWD